METTCQHLELVFLASTVSPAWSAGWAFTNTAVPSPRRRAPAPPLPPQLRLALIAA